MSDMLQLVVTHTFRPQMDTNKRRSEKINSDLRSSVIIRGLNAGRSEDNFQVRKGTLSPRALKVGIQSFIWIESRLMSQSGDSVHLPYLKIIFGP